MISSVSARLASCPSPAQSAASRGTAAAVLVLANAVEEVMEAEVGDGVQNVISFSMRGKHTLVFQDSKLLTHNGLSGARELNDFCH